MRYVELQAGDVLLYADGAILVVDADGGRARVVDLRSAVSMTFNFAASPWNEIGGSFTVLRGGQTINEGEDA